MNGSKSSKKRRIWAEYSAFCGVLTLSDFVVPRRPWNSPSTKPPGILKQCAATCKKHVRSLSVSAANACETLVLWTVSLVIVMIWAMTYPYLRLILGGTDASSLVMRQELCGS